MEKKKSNDFKDSLPGIDPVELIEGFEPLTDDEKSQFEKHLAAIEKGD